MACSCLDLHREKGKTLSFVYAMDGESFDSLLRRFNKKVQQDGILSEARRRAHFEPPYIQKKKKLATKLRKSRRASARS